MRAAVAVALPPVCGVAARCPVAAVVVALGAVRRTAYRSLAEARRAAAHAEPCRRGRRPRTGTP